MNAKPAPSQHLKTVLSGLRDRHDLIRSKIDKAEASGQLTHEKAEWCRDQLRKP